MTTSELIEQTGKYVAPTYGRFPVSVASGSGACCVDCDGKKYIDFTSGIGVNSLGFCDADWAEAVSEQAHTLNHVSNLYYTQPGAQLAKTLCTRTGYDKVFFANSGAEANECAIKLARKRSFLQHGRGRSKILTLVNSFHGRTVTTLSATGQEVFHTNFFPFTEGFGYVPANDFAALEAAFDSTVCAVMCELVQGEGGVIPLDPDYVRRVADFCEEKGLTFIVDEVQTGVGRTGTLLASEQYGVQPDATTLAKGLGGGLPIGACLMKSTCSDVLQKGDHATTFGMNPIVCAGGNVVMQKLTPAFLDAVQQKGNHIRATLSALPEVERVDGLGMMLGVALKTKRAADVVAACNEKGLLTLTAKEKVRLLPPLTITEQELKQGLAILCDVLNA